MVTTFSENHDFFLKYQIRHSAIINIWEVFNMLKWNTRLIASVVSFFICLDGYFLLFITFFFVRSAEFMIMILFFFDTRWQLKRKRKLIFHTDAFLSFQSSNLNLMQKLSFWWYGLYSVSWNMCSRHKKLFFPLDKLPTIIHLNCGIDHSFLMAQWRRGVIAAHLKIDCCHLLIYSNCYNINNNNNNNNIR